MLAAIADLKRPEASAVLAQAARYVLGAPQSSGRASEVVAELRRRVDREGQTEDQLLRHVTEALSREMSEYMLAGVDLNEVKERVGQKGLLPTSQYDVVLTPHFRAQLPLSSVKASHVLNAIAQPTLVQHLSPHINETALFNEAAPSVSLFLQTPRVNGAPYTLLIKCSRIGARLNVEDVFYLFHDSFDLSSKNSPIEVLRKFLKRFGIPVEIMGSVGNPLENVVIEFPADGRIHFRNVNGFHMGTVSGKPGNKIELLLVYSFNQADYAQYLRDHGKPSKVVGDVATLTAGGTWVAAQPPV